MSGDGCLDTDLGTLKSQVNTKHFATCMACDTGGASIDLNLNNLVYVIDSFVGVWEE